MISFSQPYELVCPTCHKPFSAEMWLIVDAEERPDLLAQIRDVTLHDATCPHCQQSGVVPAPLLYHDRRARTVLFGVPHDMDEQEWREIAQGLLWMLIGALPEDQRLPYLGELQAEAGVAGVAEMLEYLVPAPVSAAEALGDALGSDDPDEVPPLAQAMLRLGQIQTADDFQQLVAEYPFLLDDAMDDGLAGLAEAATEQGEIAVGQAFERARLTLVQLRQMLDRRQHEPEKIAEPVTVAPKPENWNDVRRLLLALDDSTEFDRVRQQHPELNNPNLSAWLADDEQTLRDIGDLAAAQTVREVRSIVEGSRRKSN